VGCNHSFSFRPVRSSCLGCPWRASAVGEWGTAWETCHKSCPNPAQACPMWPKWRSTTKKPAEHKCLAGLVFLSFHRGWQSTYRRQCTLGEAGHLQPVLRRRRGRAAGLACPDWHQPWHRPAAYSQLSRTRLLARLNPVARCPSLAGSCRSACRA